MLGLYLTKYLPMIVEYWNLLSLETPLWLTKALTLLMMYYYVVQALILWPPLLKNRQQLKNVILTRQIASLRIHVERAIGRIKQYRILSSVVPLTLVNSIDSIWSICCALSLFHPPLVTDHVV